MYIRRSLLELVEESAQARNSPPVPKQFIEEAIRRVETGEETVDRYPVTDCPSLSAIYRIAAKLEIENAHATDAPLTPLEHDRMLDDVIEGLTGPLHHH